MIILSLFDGMAGAYEAIERAGIKVDKYYCSEIDKYAHAVAKYNHPDIVKLGDVNNWRYWNIEKPDLIIGGFPCQAFSFAGKQLHFDDPRGQLFFRLLEIKEHYNPGIFLFENVKMKKDIQSEINNLLEVEPIEINSALLSAQNRCRNYWTNIPGVEQPADKGILLRDILESDSTGVIENRGGFIEQSEKSMYLDANYWKCPDNPGQRTLIVSEQKLSKETQSYKRALKSTKTPDEKALTLTATMFKGMASNGCTNIIVNNYWRKLTPLECERLQTVRDGYTDFGDFGGVIKPISNTQRYKMLGNGFTIDVIAHILKYMKGAKS